MSRRLPTSPLVRILLLLILGGCLAPLLGTPVAAFGERAYESNQVIAGTNNLDVFSGESVAQSFVATDTYRLLNLTLRLRNTGDTTDALSVAIRSDAGGVPSNTDLATAQIVIGNTVLGNYNIPFTAPPTVAGGTRYWIVATCGSLLANHYEWHHSAADVYPDGQAKINLNLGGGWVNPATPTDMYFVNFGQQVEANLTAVVLPGDQDAKPGDLVTFAVWLNNTGGSVASVAWLNDTQLPGLVYVSDTAGSAGSSTTGAAMPMASSASRRTSAAANAPSSRREPRTWPSPMACHASLTTRADASIGPTASRTRACRSRSRGPSPSSDNRSWRCAP